MLYFILSLSFIFPFLFNIIILLFIKGALIFSLISIIYGLSIFFKDFFAVLIKFFRFVRNLFRNHKGKIKIEKKFKKTINIDLI